MDDQPKPFDRLLLPIDTLEAFQRTAPLAGILINTIGISEEQIDLLHVITGAYLGPYMNTINVAAGEAPDPENMKRLRKWHIDREVKPLLSEARALLKQHSSEFTPGDLILDGDPVKVITSVCRHGDYSTVVMSRRNLAEQTAKLTGSVVAGLLHRYAESTIYLAGDERLRRSVSPFARCLIGVDGSPASRRAVQEAGLLLSRAGNAAIEKVFLVHVLDQSCYYDEIGESCMQLSAAGQKSLEEAGNSLIEAGISSDKITTVIHFGRPGAVLADEVVECDATLIFIGRRDRSRMAQIFLGSVCLDIIERCRERTLVLAS